MTRFKQINTLIGLTLLLLIVAASAHAHNRAPRFNLGHAEAAKRTAISPATMIFATRVAPREPSNTGQNVTVVKGPVRLLAIVRRAQMNNRHKLEAPGKATVATSFTG